MCFMAFHVKHAILLYRLLQYTAAHGSASPQPSRFVLGAISGLNHVVFYLVLFQKTKVNKKLMKEKHESFQKNQKMKAIEIKKLRKKTTKNNNKKKQEKKAKIKLIIKQN